MKKPGTPITDELIREYLPLELALYSVCMPADAASASIYSTRPDAEPIQTWVELIEADDVAQACVAYLVGSGAPVFRHITQLDKYTDALQEQLRRGISPAAARDAALRSQAAASGT